MTLKIRPCKGLTLQYEKTGHTVVPQFACGKGVMDLNSHDLPFCLGTVPKEETPKVFRSYYEEHLPEVKNPITGKKYPVKPGSSKLGTVKRSGLLCLRHNCE